jgi:hypothetical protein
VIALPKRNPKQQPLLTLILKSASSKRNFSRKSETSRKKSRKSKSLKRRSRRRRSLPIPSNRTKFPVKLSSKLILRKSMAT